MNTLYWYDDRAVTEWHVREVDGESHDDGDGGTHAKSPQNLPAAASCTCAVRVALVALSTEDVMQPYMGRKRRPRKETHRVEPDTRMM